MAKLVNFLICFLLAIFVFPNFLEAAMTSSNYQIWQDAISVGGGENQSSNDYILQDTLGEFGLDNSSSTSSGLKPGFRSQEFYTGQTVLSFSSSQSSLEFGQLDKHGTAVGSLVLIVETNAYTGVSITYAGATLTCSACSGINTVSPIGSTGAASIIGTSQFGFNAIYSSGSAPIASSLSPYNSENIYAFNSGDEIISSTSQINQTTFDIHFIANISGDEKNGTYTTTITYTATANF
ncbi:MAG: hypothetical protein Q7K65_05890 [Candidatus Buchananbacteria bacterium]|nr:hypothetical protein [Candidatus Buchananbacteria bacterium]